MIKNNSQAEDTQLSEKSTGSMLQVREHQNGISASKTISSVSDGMTWKIWSNMTLLIALETI